MMSGAEPTLATVRAEGDEDPGADQSQETEEVRRATEMAIAAAGASIIGFVSMFRLRVAWDQTRSRAFRRVFGVQVESLAGLVLGLLSLNRLQRVTSDKRGVPFAVVGVVLGTANLVRIFTWLRSGGRHE
jgi:hypothetical protein